MVSCYGDIIQKKTTFHLLFYADIDAAILHGLPTDAYKMFSYRADRHKHNIRTLVQKTLYANKTFYFT